MTKFQHDFISTTQNDPEFQNWVGLWGHGKFLCADPPNDKPGPRLRFDLTPFKPNNRSKKNVTVIWYTKDQRMHTAVLNLTKVEVNIAVDHPEGPQFKTKEQSKADFEKYCREYQ